MKKIEELFDELPAELQRKVEDFAKFSLETKVRPKTQKTAPQLGRCIV